MSHNHAGHIGGRHANRMLVALLLTAAFMVVEAAVGFATGSLVLVADAAHMLADVAALSLALIAIWFARRPATSGKTYGYYRVEILAALTNAALLFAVSVYILVEAARRLQSPSDVPSIPLIAVASAGLAVNLVCAYVLMAGARESLNVRAAFLDVVGDALASVGAVIAGVLILTTGWQYADPLFAAAVGVFILPRTWRLMHESINVLLEATPRGIDIAGVQASILAVPGVESVHDLHIWTVTSGFVALSGHVTVDPRADRDRTLVAIRAGLRDEFGIEHVTVQLETPQLEEILRQPCFPGESPCYGAPRPADRNEEVLRAVAPRGPDPHQ